MLSSMRKNPLEKKPYPPGEHGRGRQRQTEYGMRLLEKQKARWYYGVSEKQFRRAYDRATRMQGVSGENLLRLMELRMDNVVYRLGFATSRPQANARRRDRENGRDQVLAHERNGTKGTVDEKRSVIRNKKLRVGQDLPEPDRELSVPKILLQPGSVETDAIEGVDIAQGSEIVHRLIC